jgi:hypothetical protein
VAKILAEGAHLGSERKCSETLVAAKDSGMDYGDVMSMAGEKVGILVHDLESADGMGPGQGQQEGDVEGFESRLWHKSKSRA